jgi:hypothetical protein
VFSTITNNISAYPQGYVHHRLETTALDNSFHKEVTGICNFRIGDVLVYFDVDCLYGGYCRKATHAAEGSWEQNAYCIFHHHRFLAISLIVSGITSVKPVKNAADSLHISCCPYAEHEVTWHYYALNYGAVELITQHININNTNININIH